MNIIFETPKFSQLNNDELLFITLYNNDDPLVMTKEDFMQDTINNVHSVHFALSDTMRFDLKQIIDQIGEDAYEDWNEQVWDDIENASETKEFLQFINKVFNNHKVYYPGQQITMDVCTLKE